MRIQKQYGGLFDEIVEYLKKIYPNEVSAKEIRRNLEVGGYYAVLWRCKQLAGEGIIERN